MYIKGKNGPLNSLTVLFNKPLTTIASSEKVWQKKGIIQNSIDNIYISYCVGLSK